LHLDIVDYPGEWLLDLPLLGRSYEEFSRHAIELAQSPARADLSQEWLRLAHAADPHGEADEAAAQRLAAAFTAYLRACKDDARALSTLPPGRFLMPGDLEGSPALTFAPLPAPERPARSGTLHAMMKRRYEAYKTYVVKPFFREHVARLDRQIILVDALQALNAGPAAAADLQRALNEIMACFRHGRTGFLTGLFTRRIDRILVAATKADHLHHDNHDRLQNLVRMLVDRSLKAADFSGARVEALAMAAVRATREGTVSRGGETLPVIIGTPMAGETLGSERFDGSTETAIFPGDLPEHGIELDEAAENFPPLRFVRFRPPELERTAEGFPLSLPHIRLDRALEFLLGDKLA